MSKQKPTAQPPPGEPEPAAQKDSARLYFRSPVRIGATHETELEVDIRQLDFEHQAGVMVVGDEPGCHAVFIPWANVSCLRLPSIPAVWKLVQR